MSTALVDSRRFPAPRGRLEGRQLPWSCTAAGKQPQGRALGWGHACASVRGRQAGPAAARLHQVRRWSPGDQKHGDTFFIFS